MVMGFCVPRPFVQAGVWKASPMAARRSKEVSVKARIMDVLGDKRNWNKAARRKVISEGEKNLVC